MLIFVQASMFQMSATAQIVRSVINLNWVIVSGLLINLIRNLRSRCDTFFQVIQASCFCNVCFHPCLSTTSQFYFIVKFVNQQGIIGTLIQHNLTNPITISLLFTRIFGGHFVYLVDHHSDRTRLRQAYLTKKNKKPNSSLDNSMS